VRNAPLGPRQKDASHEHTMMLKKDSIDTSDRDCPLLSREIDHGSAADTMGTNRSSSAERSGVSSVVAGDRQQGSSFSESLSSRGHRLPNGPRQLTDTAVHGGGVVKLREASNISTWNVRTMRTDGKLEIVEVEMKRLNIGCLGSSDTSWSSVGHFLSDYGSTVLPSVQLNAQASQTTMHLEIV